MHKKRFKNPTVLIKSSTRIPAYREISLPPLMSTMRGGEWRLSSFVISPIDLGEAGPLPGHVVIT